MLRALLVLAPVALASAVALPALTGDAQTPSPTPATATSTVGPSSTPATPLASPTPPPAATPLPAPTNLRVRTESRIVDENGTPLPPERQEHTDVVTWDHRDFEGEYQIEVTLVPFSGGSPTVLETYVRFPPSRGEGMIGRVSQYPEWLNNQRCYRIRVTSPSGTGGIEIGPFSNSACTVKPPSSGTPGAPDAGTGMRAGPADRWFSLLAATVIAAAGGAAAAGALFVGRVRTRG